MSAFLVGVDSDGTVFDTMTAKHRAAFIPAAFAVWGLESCRDEFARIEENINLFSSTRGIDRFNGLYLAFKRLEAAFNPPGLPEYEGLRPFLESGAALSNKTLNEYAAKNPSKMAAQTLKWSRMSDGLFAEAAKRVPPFKNARAALKALHDKSIETAVISSAGGAGLRADFTRHGLARYVGAICGQEHGDKAAQLQAVAYGNYAAENVLMIGDAEGDRAAAKAVGAAFFPITPGREEQSWEEFLNEGLGRFLNGTFAGEYEAALYKAFKAGMPEESQTNYVWLQTINRAGFDDQL